MSRCKHIRTTVFGMTQTEFARMLGIRQSAVWELESRDALPERHQHTIRNEAIKRGLEWRDEWLFQQPEAGK
jgi:DNA-binding transcriptional regulator YiaG